MCVRERENRVWEYGVQDMEYSMGNGDCGMKNGRMENWYYIIIKSSEFFQHVDCTSDCMYEK